MMIGLKKCLDEKFPAAVKFVRVFVFLSVVTILVIQNQGNLRLAMKVSEDNHGKDTNIDDLKYDDHLTAEQYELLSQAKYQAIQDLALSIIWCIMAYGALLPHKAFEDARPYQRVSNLELS